MSDLIEQILFYSKAKPPKNLKSYISPHPLSSIRMASQSLRKALGKVNELSLLKSP